VPLGKLGRKIITNGFRSTRLLRQERLRKSAAKPTGQRAAQASQANSAVGQAGLQNKNKRFLVILSNRVFSSEKVAFFRKKPFNTTTQRRILRQAFWLIWKNS
jgi:hypothetical protein